MNTEIFVACLFAVVAAMFFGHLFWVRDMMKIFHDSVAEMQDGMAKLAQLGFIHTAAKTPMEAVAATTVLANEEAALEQKKEEVAQGPKKMPYGFRDHNGRIQRFMDDATRDRVMAKLPADKLVYAP